MSEPMIELSVRVTDGSYESKILMPTECSPESRNEFVSQWLAMQAAGLKVIQSSKKRKQQEEGE